MSAGFVKSEAVLALYLLKSVPTGFEPPASSELSLRDVTFFETTKPEATRKTPSKHIVVHDV